MWNLNRQFVLANHGRWPRVQSGYFLRSPLAMKPEAFGLARMAAEYRPDQVVEFVLRRVRREAGLDLAGA